MSAYEFLDNWALASGFFMRYKLAGGLGARGLGLRATPSNGNQKGITGSAFWVDYIDPTRPSRCGSPTIGFT